MESLIGQTFGCWTVIAKEITEKYNYKFICKCCCGNKKTIQKHDLINRKYPKCTKCKSNSIIKPKLNMVQQRWSPYLNKVIPLENNLDASKKYWFRCPQGHDYQSNILELSEKCPICSLEKSKETILKQYEENFDDTIDYLDALWSDLFEDVLIETYGNFIFRAINNDKKAIIIGIPKGFKNMDFLLYNSKQEWYNINNKIKLLSNSRYEVFITELELIYKKDSEKLFEITRSIY